MPACKLLPFTATTIATSWVVRLKKKRKRRKSRYRENNDRAPRAGLYVVRKARSHFNRASCRGQGSCVEEAVAITRREAANRRSLFFKWRWRRRRRLLPFFLASQQNASAVRPWGTTASAEASAKAGNMQCRPAYTLGMQLKAGLCNLCHDSLNHERWRHEITRLL